MYYSYKFDGDYYEYDDKRGVQCSEFNVIASPQVHQNVQPGLEYLMTPKPIFDNPNYKGSGKLKNKIAIITGGDSGLGRAAAVAFTKEGAKVVIAYLNEHTDANETKRYIEGMGGTCVLLSGNIADKDFCEHIAAVTLDTFGKIDILVNDAGVQYQQDCLEAISDEQFDHTIKVNIYGMFYLTRAVLPHLSTGSSIINLTSATFFYGEPQLIDYVTTKGAIIGFTRSLAHNLASKNIRVNAIAPGKHWTPLQVCCWVAEKIPTLTASSPMGRIAMPYELAPTFVYLASEDSSFVTGQVIHSNGGQEMG